ncbi:xanthine dehydrogenase family protein [candidate division KSB1 bacterium]|nr:xanthine dehydrogenase family protein [candidate division KSB1 bacterium]
MKKEFSTIGKHIIREDGWEKVTGQAKYGDDFNFPNQLFGVPVRVPAVHAKINHIDYSEIISDPDLIAVCNCSDIPGSAKIGPIRKDQPIFCSERVVTSGDVLSLLVGPSREKLLQLREHIRIDYEPLPILSDPSKALEDDAVLIHPEFKTNLIVHYPLRKGDIEKGFQQSDEVIEQTYTTQCIEHAYVEPEVVIAIPMGKHKGIKIIGSIQNPYTARRIVASVLNWPLTKVRIIQAELGGSFGGKDDTMNILAARAAMAALKTGRPVKICYDREDSILESYKRHPYVMHYKVGFSRNGKIRAMKIDILADGGGYASMSPFVTWRSVVQATGPYEIDHVWTDVRAVYTNNPYTGAMRGFGSPQPIFANESLMDEIAIRTNKTPDEVRRINALRQNSITASGQKLTSHDVNLVTVLDRAVEETGFSKKWRSNHTASCGPHTLSTGSEGNGDDASKLILKENDFIASSDLFKKGIGLAVSYRGCSLGAEGVDAAAAYLSVQPDGSAYLVSGLAENGQGLRTTFSMIAAEVLGLSVADIYYLEQDTGVIPDSGPTVASRSTLMGGAAVKEAAEIVRKRLEKVLMDHWNTTGAAEFNFSDHHVYATGPPNQRIRFPELCEMAFQKGISLAALGWYAGPRVDWDEETGQGPAYFTYVYGCQVAEVRVNIGTGEVYVDRIVAVHDPGKVLNLLGAHGQVFGGVTQGAGYGLWEQINSLSGQIQELNFDQYLIPTSNDIGEIVPIFIEGRDKYGPWGAKSLGEPTLELTAAAIANAVRNATGRRFFNLPLNLEEIMLGRKLINKTAMRGSHV